MWTRKSPSPPPTIFFSPVCIFTWYFTVGSIMTMQPALCRDDGEAGDRDAPCRDNGEAGDRDAPCRDDGEAGDRDGEEGRGLAASFRSPRARLGLVLPVSEGAAWPR